MDAFRTSRLSFVALLIACAPLAAQTPTVDTNTVTITYTGSASPNTGTVHVSNATNISARISPNLQSDGSVASTPSGIFVQNVTPTGATTASVNIGTDPNALGALARRGATTYSGATLLISADGCTDCVSVGLVLSITNGGGVTVTYNGAAIPSSGIQLFAAAGQSASATLTLTSTNPTAFQASSNVTWITLNPSSGQLTGSQSITMTLNASGLPTGNSSATVTISAGGVSTNIPILFSVGTGSGLTLSPNPLNFSYVTSTASFPSGQTQLVTLSGASTTATFTATANSSQGWLLVGASGGTTVTGLSVLSQLPVSINVAALNLGVAATYTGSVLVQTSDGLSATLNVNLTVSATSTTGGTNSLTFNVAVPGGATPPAQQVTISGTGSYNAFVGTNNCGQGWLQVSPTSGTLSSVATTLTVQVFPGSIGSTTCTGSISISTTGLLANGTSFQTINVTMIIGSGTTSGGAVASPTALTFTLPAGVSQSQTFIVNGNGSNFTAQAIGTNLNVFPTNGTTPAVVTVTAGAGSSSGTIVVTSSLGSQNINVTVTNPSGNVLTATPGSLAFIYQPGTNVNANISLNASLDSTGSNLTFAIASAPAFVAFAAPGTTTPASIGIGINASQLGPGLNTGNIVITTTNAANTTLTIPVTVLAPGATSGLVATPNPVSMSGIAFGGPVTQSVAVSGLSGTNFNASTISTGNWLTVSPTSGSSPASLTLTANPLTLGVGTYNATVTLTANNGTTLTIPVTFTAGTTATATPALTVSPQQLAFNYRTGDTAPAAQAVQIATNGGAASFTATTNASWINLSLPSGNTPATLNISLNTALLQMGNQTGTVTITAAGATNSPQTITVSANVTSPPVLSVNAGAASFAYHTGDPAPAAQTIQVNSSGTPLAFTVSVTSAPWLSVTPTSGTTPATLTLLADPSKLSGVGQSTATITINAAGSSQTVTVTLTVSAPLPSILEVHNGASNQPGPIAPGLIIVVTGSGMGPDTIVQNTATGDVFGTTVSGTRVLIGGFAAPMLYTSANQVAAIVPYDLAGRTSTFVQVEYLGQRSNAVTVQVANTSPALFTLNASGTGPGAIYNQDGTINSATNPESVNRSIVLFGTGEGQTIPAGVNGKLADDPVLPKPVFPVTAKINGTPADVQYYGAAPGLVAGVLQVNILVPPGATSGDVIISIGGNDSPKGVTVAIR